MSQTSVRARGKAICAAASALAVLTIAPSVALAHPDHATGFLPGLLHPFQGLDHLLAAIAVGLWGSRIGGRATWAFPIAFVAAMIAGGLLWDAGLALPAMEIMIALSVLFLGCAVASNARCGVPVGVAVVAAFALFHGGAHGVETPVRDGFMNHASGLALATAALHAAGITIAAWLKTRPWVLRLAAAPIALLGAAMLVARLA